MKLLKRSLAASDAFFLQFKEAVWTKWNIGKMVNEGLQENSWVYRAILIVSQNASQVPWVVVNKDGEFLYEHPISKLLARPNKHFTRQKLFELLIMWLELAGTGYLKKVQIGGATKEIWPVSPDRIAPIPSTDPEVFISGYEVVEAGGVKKRSEDFTPENVIFLKLTDPSNPWRGLSPLGAAARAVDLDNSQQNWNVATMQNRGVVDGVFTFDRQLDPTQSDSIMERIKAKFGGGENARKPLVVGDNAKYTRLGLTPVEIDFLNSRKFNREEIFTIYGIPPQLGGSQETSSYNNFSVALRILWELTLIPLLDNVKDTLNHAFEDELGEGASITYDLSGVDAIRDSDDQKSIIVGKYHDLGVPMSQLNEKYELGFKPYPGWDESRPKSSAPQAAPAADTDQARYALIPLEQRNLEKEIKTRDDLAEGPVAEIFTNVLDHTRKLVFDALEAGQNPVETIKAARPEWREAISKSYKMVMKEFIPTIAKREGSEAWEVRADPAVDQAINQALEQEAIILKELSLIEAATIRKILAQVQYGTDAGSSVANIQQAIMDTGIFSPQRALTIARTIAGAASSMGQMTAAGMSGAKNKEWLTSKAHVREWHTVREGEKVPLDQRFSAQRGGIGPRYPCDGDVSAEDRINCRCFMAFSRG